MRVLVTMLLLLSLQKGVSQDVEIVKLEDVISILDNKNDTLYIVNFWATWCGPCVKELPYFEQITKENSENKVKVVLVSLDFKSDLENKVKPFIKKRNIESDVWLLDETNQNKFIPLIDESWSGAIPFTIALNFTNDYKFSKEGEINLVELNKLVNEEKLK